MIRRRLLGLDTTTDTVIRARYLLGDGAEYLFVLQWRLRDLDWTVSIYAVDGSAVTEGIRCATGQDLLAAVPGADALGRLVVEDPTGAHREPGRHAWREGFRLVLETPSPAEAAG